jgi:hypothetical protein
MDSHAVPNDNSKQLVKGVTGVFAGVRIAKFGWADNTFHTGRGTYKRSALS